MKLLFICIRKKIEFSGGIKGGKKKIGVRNIKKHEQSVPVSQPSNIYIYISWKVVRLEYREVKMTLDTSCDDQKVGQVRNDMYIENKILKYAKVRRHFSCIETGKESLSKEVLSQSILMKKKCQGGYNGYIALPKSIFLFIYIYIYIYEVPSISFHTFLDRHLQLT